MPSVSVRKAERERAREREGGETMACKGGVNIKWPFVDGPYCRSHRTLLRAGSVLVSVRVLAGMQQETHGGEAARFAGVIAENKQARWSVARSR